MIWSFSRLRPSINEISHEHFFSKYLWNCESFLLSQNRDNTLIRLSGTTRENSFFRAFAVIWIKVTANARKNEFSLVVIRKKFMALSDWPKTGFPSWVNTYTTNKLQKTAFGLTVPKFQTSKVRRLQ